MGISHLLIMKNAGLLDFYTSTKFKEVGKLVAKLAPKLVPKIEKRVDFK